MIHSQSEPSEAVAVVIASEAKQSPLAEKDVLEIATSPLRAPRNDIRPLTDLVSI